MDDEAVSLDALAVPSPVGDEAVWAMDGAVVWASDEAIVWASDGAVVWPVGWLACVVDWPADCPVWPAAAASPSPS